MTLKTAF